MPKVLIYIVKRIMWLFLFWNTDANEDRAHVHIGKKGSQKLCKIWLEPSVEVADNGEFTDSQVKEMLLLTEQYREQLLKQWKLFKQGKQIRIIKITK